MHVLFSFFLLFWKNFHRASRHLEHNITTKSGFPDDLMKPLRTSGTPSRTPCGPVVKKKKDFQRSSSGDKLAADTFHAAQFHMPFVSLRPNWSFSWQLQFYKARWHPAVVAYHPLEE